VHRGRLPRPEDDDVVRRPAQRRPVQLRDRLGDAELVAPASLVELRPAVEEDLDWHLQGEHPGNLDLTET
jgi:hypothetical protein